MSIESFKDRGGVDFQSWTKGDLTVQKAPEIDSKEETVTAYFKDSKGNVIKVTTQDPRVVDYLSGKPGGQSEKAKEWFRELSATFSKKIGNVQNSEVEIVQTTRGERVVEFNVRKGGGISKGVASWELSKNPIKALWKGIKESAKVSVAGGIGYDGNIEGYEQAGKGMPDKIRGLSDPKGLQRINWKNVLLHVDEVEARVAAVPLKNLAKMEDPSDAFNNLIKTLGDDPELIAKLPWDELTPEEMEKLLCCLRPEKVGIKALQNVVEALKGQPGQSNTGPIKVFDAIYGKNNPETLEKANVAIEGYFSDPVNKIAALTIGDNIRNTEYTLEVDDKRISFKNYKEIAIDDTNREPTQELKDIFSPDEMDKLRLEWGDNFIRFGLFLKDLKAALGETEYNTWISGILSVISQSAQNGASYAFKDKAFQVNTVVGEEMIECKMDAYEGKPVVVVVHKNSDGAIDRLDLNVTARISLEGYPSSEKRVDYQVTKSEGKYHLAITKEEVKFFKNQ